MGFHALTVRGAVVDVEPLLFSTVSVRGRLFSMKTICDWVVLRNDATVASFATSVSDSRTGRLVYESAFSVDVPPHASNCFQ